MALYETDLIKVLQGVGNVRVELYEKLGVRRVGDLIAHFPRAYEDWSHPITAADAPFGEACCIRAAVTSPPVEHRVRKGMTYYRFWVDDGVLPVQITLFNNRYLAAKIRTGATLLLYGTVERRAGRLEMTSPAIEFSAVGKIRPIYPSTGDLSTRTIEKNIRDALDGLGTLEETLPDYLVREQALMSRDAAVRTLHFPEDHAALQEAKRRLVFEELLFLQLGLMGMKKREKALTGARITVDHTDEYTAGLPFCLTGAQKRAIADCVRDAEKQTPMARLVQGDVGSGKTAVAAGVAYTVIRNGFQVAMMAPTEILARQHAESLQTLLGDGIRVALLTGSVTGARRKALEAAIAAGEADLVVGTHAILTESVVFARLGLVITDEQHRFGVRQRAALAAKGEHPHLLVMSATPIPRTLALILYGDLDVSVLDELPPGRQPVETFAVSSAKRDRAYGYVRKFLDEGRQGFIVCPLVEEGEELSSSAELKSATAMFESLSAGPFAGYRLGLLHGRMKPKEKEAVMEAFSAGDVQLLVSTTVIEVGVDVPNAVMMVIENAERFGLAQLHQLRGRVGRGKHASTCILISDNGGEENRRRLTVMCETNDGFRIADEDLKLRGPGELFGDRQHGLPTLHMADLTGDTRMLKSAQDRALSVLAADPDLQRPENALLRQGVDRLFAQVGDQGLN